MRVRVVTWNVSCMRSTAPKVAALAHVLAEVAPETVVLAALLEVTEHARPSFASLFSAAAYSLDLRKPGPLDTKGRKLGVMIGVRNAQLVRSEVVARAPYPDRTLAAQVLLKGETRMHVVGAHALTGVGYLRAKGDQFRALAEYLTEGRAGPLRIFCLDANEPDVDAVDLRESKFHDNKDDGDGARLLLGHGADHGLVDALRCRLAERPFAPHSPEALVASHFTKKRACRYDQCWVSQDWTVNNVEYRYQDAVEAGSDHALVVVDLSLAEKEGDRETRPVQGDGTPAMGAVLDVLTRAPIPPGQLALFKALLAAPPDGLTAVELADAMRGGDTRGLAGILGGLGKRVNQTAAFAESRPGARFLVQEKDGSYRALPLLAAAIESLPDLEAKLAETYDALYSVADDPGQWFRVKPRAATGVEP